MLNTALLDFIAELERRVLGGGEVTVDEGARLLEQTTDAELGSLMAAADRIRRHFVGPDVHLCSIVNAKSGRCSEDCGFCAQSVRFKTGIDEYELLDEDATLKAAREAAGHGAEALGIVAAWRGLRDGTAELEGVLERIRAVTRDGAVAADASLGLIDDPEVARKLKQAGLHTYNHNLETARSHFGTVCKTHDYDDRLRTIELVREAGIHVCCGGIVGMGETPRQRAELAAELRGIDPDIVPLNFLNPIEGTPMGQVRTPLRPLEALTCISVFRFMLPRNHLMVAGGREVVLRSLQPMMFLAGASATMVGNYLTTAGKPASEDLQMLADLEIATTPAHHGAPVA